MPCSRFVKIIGSTPSANVYTSLALKLHTIDAWLCSSCILYSTVATSIQIAISSAPNRSTNSSRSQRASTKILCVLRKKKTAVCRELKGPVLNNNLFLFAHYVSLRRSISLRLSFPCFFSFFLFTSSLGLSLRISATISLCTHRETNFQQATARLSFAFKLRKKPSCRAAYLFKLLFRPFQHPLLSIQ